MQAPARIVITLTTVPERLSNPSTDGFKLVIESLCKQRFDQYEIHLNIPHIYNITGEQYIIPTWLSDCLAEYKHLKLYRVDDIGPSTKVVPTLLREQPDALIIVVDDDLIYHPDMVAEHVKYHAILPGSVILYDGRNSVDVKYGDLRDYWIICTSKITRVKSLQHYKSASYYVHYFKSDFYDWFLGKTKSDDVLMSYYFKKHEIKMYVVPYEPDVDKVNTSYDDWYKFQGVETFPVVRHARSISNTGCNHPDILKVEPKFYVPPEFVEIDKTATFS